MGAYLDLKKRVLSMNTKFLKYAFIGAVATLLDWGAFYLLSFELNVYYQIAVFISFTLGATTKFLFNKFITFKNYSKRFARQISIFVVVSIIGVLASAFFMYVFVDVLQVHKFLSRVITTIIVLFLNYFLDSSFTFRKDR